jgi:hypothetical protein
LLKPFSHIYTLEGEPFMSELDVLEARDFISNTPTDGRSLET